jgi:hypothetical protein
MPIDVVFRTGLEYLVFNCAIGAIFGIFIVFGFAAGGEAGIILFIVGLIIFTTGMFGLGIKAIADGTSYAIYHNRNTGPIIPSSIKLVSRTGDPNSNNNPSRVCSNCGVSNILANIVCTSCSGRLK